MEEVKETMEEVRTKDMNIPFWQMYTLTIEKAAKYFGIGENKLRQIVNDNKRADFILWNGNRALIKRKKFELFIDSLDMI